MSGERNDLAFEHWWNEQKLGGFSNDEITADHVYAAWVEAQAPLRESERSLLGDLLAANNEISTLRAQVEALREALASVENQAEIADDPEHHTLSLVKYIARAALAQEGKVEESEQAFDEKIARDGEAGRLDERENAAREALKAGRVKEL